MRYKFLHNSIWDFEEDTNQIDGVSIQHKQFHIR